MMWLILGKEVKVMKSKTAETLGTVHTHTHTHTHTLILYLQKKGGMLII